MAQPSISNPLVELRAYQARPGLRPALIDLFETVFLDAYETSGARIEATFIDRLAPDRWVWIRSFDSPEGRGVALTRFYGSDCWKRLAAQCGALMVKVEWARLLRSASPDSSLPAVADATLPDCIDPGWQLDILPRGLGRLQTSSGLTFETDTSPNAYPRQRVLKSPVSVSLSPASYSPQSGPPAGATRFWLTPTSRSRLR
jgi:hypothetical protein